MYATVMICDDDKCLKSFQIVFDRYETAFAILSQTNRYANNICPTALHTRLCMFSECITEDPYTMHTDLWCKRQKEGRFTQAALPGCF